MKLRPGSLEAVEVPRIAVFSLDQAHVMAGMRKAYEFQIPGLAAGSALSGAGLGIEERHEHQSTKRGKEIPRTE